MNARDRYRGVSERSMVAEAVPQSHASCLSADHGLPAVTLLTGPHRAAPVDTATSQTSGCVFIVTADNVEINCSQESLAL